MSDQTSSNSLVSELLDAVIDFLNRSHGVYGPEINRLARAADRVKKARINLDRESPFCAGCDNRRSAPTKRDGYRCPIHTTPEKTCACCDTEARTNAQRRERDRLHEST